MKDFQDQLNLDEVDRCGVLCPKLGLFFLILTDWRAPLEKLISIWSFRISLASVALALLFRAFATLAISVGRLGVSGGLPINYRTFYDGAILFLLLAIASSCLGSKSQ